MSYEKMKEITFIPLDFTTERITERGRAGSGMASVLFGFSIGFLLYLSIVIYGQTIMSGVLEEKTTRVAEVVMSSVPTDTLLAGKVLGVGAVGLTQQILWIATTYVLLKLRAPIMARFGAPTMNFSLPDVSLGAGVLFLLFFLLGFIFYSSLYAAVGSSVNSESEARQAATPLLIVIVSTGVFIQPVLLNPTGTFARVLSLIPISSPIIMPIRMAVTGVPPLELAASLGLRRRPLAGVADLPGGAPYVRKETHHQGNGTVGVVCQVKPTARSVTSVLSSALPLLFINHPLIEERYEDVRRTIRHPDAPGAHPARRRGDAHTAGSRRQAEGRAGDHARGRQFGLRMRRSQCASRRCQGDPARHET